MYAFPFESEDIDAMLADSLYSMTVGSVTHPCLFDVRDELLVGQGGGAPQIGRMEVAVVKTEHFPTIAQDNALVIAVHDPVWGGPVLSTTNYTVLRILQGGAMTELLLRRVTS